MTKGTNPTTINNNVVSPQSNSLPVLEECKDPKAKQYRDKSRAVQLKLKGPRFEASRVELRTGLTDAKTFLRDDYVQGRAQGGATTVQPGQPQMRAGSAPMQTVGFPVGGPRPPIMPGAGMPRPPGMMRPPGPGGPMMRPRFPPGGAIFRPPPSQAMIPSPQQMFEQHQQHQQQLPSDSQQNVESSVAPSREHIRQDEREDIVPESIGGQQQRHPSSRRQSSSEIQYQPDQNEYHSQVETSERQRRESFDNQNIFHQRQDHNQEGQIHQREERNGQAEIAHNESSFNTSTNLINQSLEIQATIEDGEGGNIHSQKKKKIKKKKKKNVNATDMANQQDSFIQEGGDVLHTEGDQHLEEHAPRQMDEMLENPSIEEVGLRQNSDNADQIATQVRQNQRESSRKASIEDDQSFIYSTQYNKPSDSPPYINSFAPDQSLPEPAVNNYIHQDEQREKSIRRDSSRKQSSVEDNVEETKEEVSQFTHQQRETFIEHSSSDGENSKPSQQNFILERPLQNQANLTLEQTGFSKEALIQNMRSSSQNRAQSVHSVTTLSQPHDQQSDPMKRLQDSLSYKRAQKKELTEKLVHLENDNALQQKKTAMLQDENKQMSAELRQRERDIQQLKLQSEVQEKQLQLTIKSLERQLREKNAEIEQVKRDTLKRKEKEERSSTNQMAIINQMKERQHQAAQDSNSQLNYLQNLLRTLEGRIGNSGHSNNSGGVSPVLGSGGGSSSNNNNNNNEGAGASNYQQQEFLIESVQKEMREMKHQYENKIRELNEELQSRMRNLQRVERQNVQLQEKNIKLNNIVQNIEVSQLSTVAGSGSNQRDAASMLNFGNSGQGRRSALGGVAGVSDNLINEDDGSHQQRAGLIRQGGNRNQQLQYMVGEDEGTGGMNQHTAMIRTHQMNQDYHGFGGGGEDIGSGLEGPGMNAAPVVGTGSGGGVGTTSASLFNDAFDEDEGYIHMGESSNNQLRNVAGIVHRPQQVQSSGAAINQIHIDSSNAIGSGGAHPENDIDEGEEDEEEEDEEGGQDNADEDDLDDEDIGGDLDDQEEDYDQMDGAEEGCYDADGGLDIGGNAGAAGGLEEGAGEDEGGNYDFEEGGDNGQSEEEGNEYDGNVPDGEGGNRIPRRQGKKTIGAAHGLNSGTAGFQQNIQGGNMDGDQRSHQNYGGFSTNFQQDIGDEDDIIGGQSSGNPHNQTQRAGAIGIPHSSITARQGAAVRRGAPSNEERKHGSQQQQKGQRRGNRQQNQQHTNVAGNATGSGGSSNMQNPRHPRNSRGRQQRSNQQHILQQNLAAQSATSAHQLQHSLYGDMQSSITGSMAVSSGGVVGNNAPPSSQVPHQSTRQQQQQQEYFQSFGDSSSHYGTSGGNNNRNATSVEQSSIAVPSDLGHTNYNSQGRQTSFHQLHQVPVASGGGVVHTVGRQSQQQHSTSVDSMMSAESGSTALLLDRANNYPPHGGGGTAGNMGALRTQQMGALPNSAPFATHNGVAGQRSNVAQTTNNQQLSSIQHHQIQQTGQTNNNNSQHMFLSGSGGMSGIASGLGVSGQLSGASTSELFQEGPSATINPPLHQLGGNATPSTVNESSSTAAVGGAAPPQSRAVAPRQRQQQNNQQHSAGGNQHYIGGGSAQGNFMQAPSTNPFEELKQSSGGEVPSATSVFYSNNNQQQLPPPPMVMRQGVHHHVTTNQQQQIFNVMVGGSSGEQEEESSSGLHFSSNAAIPYHHGGSSHHNNQQFGAGSGSGGGASSNPFERPGRLNLGSTNQQQQQQRSSGGRATGDHLDQSYHNARNDSCKTSGANTPNKDGADTPTTKAYRNQQQQNSFVHNLTSSQLFFSNQDEGSAANSGDMGFGGQQMLGQAATLQQQFGVRAGGGPVAGGSQQNAATSDAQVIGPGMFD